MNERVMARRVEDLGGYALKPVPAAPTHCTRCGDWLEPLRRYAGLCKDCVATLIRRARKRDARRRVIERFTRDRGGGRHEKFVRLECGCGKRSTVQESRWKRERPGCCNRCRLKEIRSHGFQAEIGR